MEWGFHFAEKMIEENQKNIFFGLELDAPWPEELPEGRAIDAENRHVTLAFLGKVDVTSLLKNPEEIPKPSFRIGKVGKFDQCLFLPKKDHARVVAWHLHLFEDHECINTFQQSLTGFLQEKGFEVKGGFLPHLTMARKPFQTRLWKDAFTPLPFYIKAFHLYESLGQLKYRSLWHTPFIHPFKEISHIADIAFEVRGENMQQLHLNAKVALAFIFPPIVNYFTDHLCDRIEDIIIDLNAIVTRVDSEIGCMFKAISFSGEVKEDANKCVNWEMIIDV